MHAKKLALADLELYLSRQKLFARFEKQEIITIGIVKEISSENDSGDVFAIMIHFEWTTILGSNSGKGSRVASTNIEYDRIERFEKPLMVMCSSNGQKLECVCSNGEKLKISFLPDDFARAEGLRKLREQPH